MFHRKNDLDILECLRRGPSHIRELAQKLSLSPATVMRILGRLEGERVVDFRTQGKNKSYFLKESIEARTYVLMLEKYKLLRLLEQPVLRRMVERVKEITRGELVVLFGSYAKGTEKPSSDIDLYVETTNRQLREQIKSISGKISVKIGNLDKTSELAAEIHKDHIILQNGERYYEIFTTRVSANTGQ